MTAPPPFAAIPPRGLPELKEHDACALAGFATRDGRPSRAMLERALKSLQLMVHRSGSVDGEGDGSGLMVDLPRPTWRRRLEAEGLDPAAADEARFTVAHIFFDSPAEAERGVPLILTLLGEHGFEVVWSGEGTVNRGALGPRAAETPPIFWQIACLAGEPGAPASRACYRAMVAIEREVDCHVASFSANDAVYKVQGQPEVIPRFYPEMQEEDFASSRIIAHNRYSTNTYPTFSRVQPFSILGHNGEINTIAQLREQSEQLGLPITRDGSDSQDLNRLLEGLIFEKGLSLLEAVEFALPPILGEVHRLPAKLQDLYVHYREALGPYAQGPVALASRAADEMVFSVDAMGLRPLWWIETDELYVVSSEPGIVPVAELTRDPAPLAPGEKIALLTGQDGVPVVLDYPDAAARGLPPRQGPRRPAHRRDARPPGGRPRAGRGRGVQRRGRGPRARARAGDPAGLGRLDRERQAAAPVPRRPRRRADRLPGLGRAAGAVHAGADAALGLLPGDGRGRHQPGHRPRARGRALLDPRRARPPAPDRGRRARAAPALRAAHAHDPGRDARAAPRRSPCRRCAASPSARAWPAWRTCWPPGTGARFACRCTSRPAAACASTSPPSPRPRPRPCATAPSCWCCRTSRPAPATASATPTWRSRRSTRRCARP